MPQRDEKWLAEVLGWTEPGEKGVNEMLQSLRRASGDRAYQEHVDVFSKLKEAAGGKSFTYLGRVVQPTDTFEDVLKKIPVAELETAAGVGRALALNAWKHVVPSAPPLPPRRGGAQQLGIYKFSSLIGSAQAAVPHEKEAEAPLWSRDTDGWFVDLKENLRGLIGYVGLFGLKDTLEMIQAKRRREPEEY